MSSSEAPADCSISGRAAALAVEIDRQMAAGRTELMAPAAVQALFGALCRLYGAQIDAGEDYLPVASRQSVTASDIMTMTSRLLRGGGLQVFELAMWQSWTGG